MKKNNIKLSHLAERLYAGVTISPYGVSEDSWFWHTGLYNWEDVKKELIDTELVILQKDSNDIEYITTSEFSEISLERRKTF